MEFTVVSQMLENVKNTKGAPKKFLVMQKGLKKIKSDIQQTMDESDKHDAFFGVIRLIVPYLDRERPAYNIKESKISRILIKMLCLGPGNDYLTLQHAKKYNLGDVAQSIMRKYISNFKSELTIHELNISLDKIANRKTDAELDDIVLQMFRKASPQDVKWIILIILKNMRLGIDGNRILNAFHKDGASFYATNTSLKRVCEVLWDSEMSIDELYVNIFEAFQPMLSKRCDPRCLRKDLNDNHLYYVENKFDGERFQIHMDSGQFKYFSRRGFDFTSEYGASFNEGTLTPSLKTCFYDNVKRVILDGEMMLWDKYSQILRSKGMESDVKHLAYSNFFQPCFIVYDIILLNENVLTKQPLATRLKNLRKVIKNEIEGTLMVSKFKEVHSRQEIADALNEAVEKEEEGILIKDPKSVYKFGSRISGWFKMKLEYFVDGLHDLDVILLGGLYEKCKNLRSFIVGVRSGYTDEGLPRFVSFGRVSTGLKFPELCKLWNRFRYKGHKMESLESLGKNRIEFGKEKPDVWLLPDDTLTLVMRITELVRTNNSSYVVPFNMRFPRIVRVREDKPVEDCLTLSELINFTGDDKEIIKFNKNKLDLKEVMEEKPKAKKKIQPLQSTVDLIESKYDFLEGIKFYIYSIGPEVSLADLENSVRRGKGFVTVKMDAEVDVVLVGLENNKLGDFVRKHNNTDIISLKWLNRVIKAQSLLPYKQEEIINLSDTENFMSDSFDRYGDSFTEETTVTSLKRTFELISQKEGTSFKKQRL